MNGTKNYYGGYDNIYEVIKIIEHFNLDFREGNVLKYLLRAGKKDPSTRLEDLRKGLYYFQRLVDSEAQKDITINIKCEDTLSPFLTNIPFETGGVLHPTRKVWDGGDNPTKEVSYFKGNLIGKAVFYFEDLRVGCAIQAIDPCFVNGNEEKAPTLTVNCFYIVSKIDGNRFMVIDDMKQDHWFRFNGKDKHQFFNISSKKEHHNDVSPKIISELKVGDEIKAIKNGFAGGDQLFEKDKIYVIKKQVNGLFGIDTETNETYIIETEDLHKYFHVSTE